MPVMSLDMNTLQADLGRIPAGEAVHISLLTKGPPTEDQMQGLVDSLASGGIQLLAPVKAVAMEWDGYQVSAIDLNFVNPGTPAPGTTAFLPMLILILVGIGAAGYLIWKAGDIAEDSVAAIVQKLPWILGIVGVIWLISKNMDKKTSRR